MCSSDLTPEELYQKVLATFGDRRSNANRVVNDTGEIRRYSSPALLLIDTPRAQAATGQLDQLSRTGDRLADLALESPMTRGTVSLVSLDGKPLRNSERMLLTAVANAANRSIRADSSKGLLYDLGNAPVVAEPFTASIRLRNALPLKVYRLDPATGERTGEVQAERKGEELSFKLTPDDRTIYFELAP